MTDDSLWIDGPDGFEDLDTTPKPKRKPRQAQKKGDGRHIGCPLWWLKTVAPLVRSKNELLGALALWRLRVVHGSRTFKVPNMGLLAELGIDRQTKYRTLKKLAAAGVITVKHNGQHAPVVTLPKGGRHV